MPEIILGSQSPRRNEILGNFSLVFKQISSDFDEESIPFMGNPSEFVCAIAKGKAESLMRQHDESIVITADTIVHRGHKIYCKPKDPLEAFDNLKELTGLWHSVFTAVVVAYQGGLWMTVEESKVLFNELTDGQINHYLQCIKWQDKAGGYAIQLPGGLLVKKIEGCYYNVLGLPINSLRMLLKQVNIDLWDYLKREA